MPIIRHSHVGSFYVQRPPNCVSFTYVSASSLVKNESSLGGYNSSVSYRTVYVPYSSSESFYRVADCAGGGECGYPCNDDHDVPSFYHV